MNTNDLKPGEQYNVRMTFDHINDDGKYYFFIELAPYIYRFFPKQVVENCVSPLTAPPQHDPAYLELVTPVEELEPYKLIDSPNTYNIVRNRSMVMTIHKKSYPNAQAAAEAACARLNAEWRKEQK